MIDLEERKEQDVMISALSRQLRHLLDLSRREFVEDTRKFPTIQDDLRALNRDWQSVGEELSREVNRSGRRHSED